MSDIDRDGLNKRFFGSRDAVITLWRDLKTRQDKIDFIKSGKAREADIMAPCIEADMLELFRDSQRTKPSVAFKPKLYRDGDQWCALYGEDMQAGVSGFGASPHKAMADFDKNWMAEDAVVKSG